MAWLDDAWTGTDSRAGGRLGIRRCVWVAVAAVIWRIGIVCSKPVAMTVMRILFVIFSSMTAPKIRFTSGCAVSRMMAAAWLISYSVMSGPPVTLNRMPRAPSMVTSSNRLDRACVAASRARSSPEPSPTAISAAPPIDMMVFTSAKSRLIRPGTVISSLMPWMPWRRMSSAMRNESSSDTRLSAVSSRRSLGMTISVSTCSFSCSMPASADRARCDPSKVNGRVTTPMVSAPASRAARATVGVAPVPVPPPMPAVTKTISEPVSVWRSSSSDSSAARAPVSGSPPEPRPRVVRSPMAMRTGAMLPNSACWSVLTATNSTPTMFSLIMRFTALLPPPPTPITRINAEPSVAGIRCASLPL